jgi:Phosphotransferase enzyme family
MPMLNTDTVTPYLLAQRLLNTGAIIDGELTIVSAARRNRNLRVEGPAGVGYLIKQPDDSGQDSYSTLHCEAAFYAFCQQQAEVTAMSRLLPRLVHFDAEESLLVLELLRSATPLWQYYWTHVAEHLPTNISRAFGHALGVVHKIFRVFASAWTEDTHLPWLYRNPPWVMQLHKPAPEMLARLSAGNYLTLRILQTQDGISKQLDGLRDLWRPETIIHNDVKGDNILVVPTGPGQDSTNVEIRIVDWEMVQIGDPAWDLAGALQDFVLFWIASLPLASGVSIEQATAQTRYPWTAVKVAIRAMWQGYLNSAEPEVGEATTLLARAVMFSAARLIQAAYEMSQGAARLTTQAVLLLQISANLLNEPDVAQVHFYGIPSTFRV